MTRPCKHLILASFDALSVLSISIAILLVTAPPAYAYVDPSVMTYAIQALASVAVAISAVLGVVWRRARRWLYKTLDIDVNAKKETEARVHRIEDGTVIMSDDEKRSRRAASKATRSARPRLRWKSRIGYALLFSAALVVTICVVPPLEIVESNSASLIFGVGEVWWVVVVFAAICVLILALLASILRGRAFAVCMIVFAGITIAAYVQALILNRGLPIADGSVVIWDDYTTITVINAGVWVVIIAALIFFTRKHRMRWVTLSAAFMVFLVLVQVVGLCGLFIKNGISSTGQIDKKVYVTEEGLFQLSPKKNVVVFVLDTFDTRDMQQLLTEDPDILSPLTDFTYFRNSSGSFVPTRYAVPFLLTGSLPQTDETFKSYLNAEYSRSTFTQDIHDAGYSIGIYTDSTHLERMDSETASAFEGRTLNMHPLREPNLDVLGSLHILEKASLYRMLPWVFKPYFWFYTDEMNIKMVATHDGTDFGNVQYLMDDAAFNETLESNGISLTDSSDKGAFRFIHLDGVHIPYTLDENGHRSSRDLTDLDTQARGSLRIVFNYIDQLKELGIYDDTTIIVTADHGKWYLTPDPLIEVTDPIMLVKPAVSTGNSGKPIAVSDMPVSHVDFQPTVIDAVGGDSSTYGQTVFQIDDPNRKRYFDWLTSDGTQDKEIIQYEIDGDALDFSDWHLTGVSWDPQQ